MTLREGIKFETYEVLSPLGRGGMGEVYRARDTKLNRDVALKVLPAVFASEPERMARFEREAKLLASLNHANIASIYGFEEANGTRALVMELAEGPTLADRVRQGPIPIDEALPIARQIADALEYAHERGVVHRDLKPANIKISPDDSVKILDFGIAKAVQGEAGAGAPVLDNSPTISQMATQAGVLLGTAAYMSPEQAKAKPVDRRADIWAFGCVLYEMLTGKPAFGGETVTDILAAVMRDEPDWTALPKNTPAHVRVLLERCLQRDPKQRLRDIGDARISLDEVLSGAAKELVASAAGYQPVWRRVFLWGVVGLIVGMVIAGLIVWRAVAPAPQPAMHFSAVTNFAGVQADPAISPDGRSVAFVSNRDGHFNVYVGLVGGGSLIQVTHGSNLKSSPVWSPDGTTLAYARLNHWGVWDVWEVPALGGTPRRVILNAADPTWSPDGHSLAYVNMADGAIWVSGISGENARLAVPPLPFPGLDTQPHFSPNGQQIALAARSVAGGPYGELAVADLNSGKTRLLTHDNALALSPAWSADGRFIYFASSRGGTINIWKIAATGGEPVQITAGEGDDADLDVSKDGKEIVFGTLRQKIGIAQLDLQAKSGQLSVTMLTNDPSRNQFSPAYSPDGKHLAYFTNLKGAEREAIWVSDADGSNAAPLVQDSRVNILPAWTPDGKDVIYYSESAHPPLDRELRSIPVSGGSPETLLKVPGLSFADVGPDGRLLYLGAKDRVETFDPRDGKKQTLVTLPVVPAWSLLRWSPDDRSVAYVLSPTKADDPNAGLWVNDFKSAPRQIFQGWVIWFARGPGNEIYLLQGKPDLSGGLWKVNWNGQGLTRTPWTVPLPYDFNYFHTVALCGFDVSPDGHYLAFQKESVLQESLGMIQNVR